MEKEVLNKISKKNIKVNLFYITSRGCNYGWHIVASGWQIGTLIITNNNIN